jgi:RNA polymerase primary sigma factor
MEHRKFLFEDEEEEFQAEGMGTVEGEASEEPDIFSQQIDPSLIESFVPDKDSLDAFLKSISKIPLLTRKEEIELAKKAKAGDREALKKLVESNLRFVVSVAKKYLGCGLPLHDLIAEGILGLIEAARRFDPDKDSMNQFLNTKKKIHIKQKRKKINMQRRQRAVNKTH